MILVAPRGSLKLALPVDSTTSLQGPLPAYLLFLCAALIEHGATSAKDLYRSIALHRFDDYGLSVDLQHHKIDWLPRKQLYKADAVVILQKIASSTLYLDDTADL